jgi:hypothetical protein
VSLGAASVLAHAGDARYRILGGEALIVQQRSAQVMGLDPVGTRLFALLDGWRSLAALIELLDREYEVPREVLERDVLAFAAELVAAGVAEVRNDGAP